MSIALHAIEVMSYNLCLLTSNVIKMVTFVKIFVSNKNRYKKAI